MFSLTLAHLHTNFCVPDREEATKEDDLGLGGDYDDEEEDEWEGEVEWTEEENDEGEDVKDESATYLEFLSQQV